MLWGLREVGLAILLSGLTEMYLEIDRLESICVAIVEFIVTVADFY